MLLSTLLIAVAAGQSAGANQPRLSPGAALPSFKGNDLSGAEVTLPAAAAGKVTVIAFGFSYGSRTAVEDWSRHLRDAHAGNQRLTWYQVPMIGGLGRLAKPFINGGMKKATPPAEYSHTVTVFGGTGAWKERLGVKDDGLAYLVLIDAGGIVRWVHAGPFDSVPAAELDRQIRALLDTGAQGAATIPA